MYMLYMLFESRGFEALFASNYMYMHMYDPVLT